MSAVETLPERLHLNMFRRASIQVLQDLYKALFRRVAERESNLFIFAEGGFHPGRVLDELDEQIRRWPDPVRRPPLFGVPVGVKDIFRTAGYAIHCGSLLPSSLFRGEEASLVSALKQAGAVVLGITASTEFAFAEPSATRNPQNTAHTPGGSSSGSAAGIAAGYFPLALGTQTMGSVVRPAAFCGVVGMKPSHGLLPGDGLIFFAPSVDQAGFFCASAADAALVLNTFVPAGNSLDSKSNWTLAVPQGPYLKEVDPEALAVFDAFCRRLVRRDGIVLKKLPLFDNWPDIARRHESLVAAELAEIHKDWLPDFNSLYRPRTRDFILKGRQEGKGAVTQGNASRLRLRATLGELMQSEAIDAFIVPSAVGEAPGSRDYTGNPIMNVPWTHAGLPVLCLPIGTGPRGLPLGVQVVGRYGEDHALPTLGRLLETLCA